MKKNHIKTSVWLVAALFAVFTAKAQTNASDKKAADSTSRNNFDFINNEQGKHVERIQIDWDDKVYKVELVNDKLTALYVDGEKIPAADWDKYGDLIAEIREQIRKNKIQAARNQEQARLNQIQEKKNEQQAVRNQEQAQSNEIQAKKNQDQDVRNEEQVRLNQIQEKKNEEQAVRNQEQAAHNQDQAVHNEEQARLNQIQAKKNQEQAEENERFMKQITADLVNDKIIPDGNGLHNLTFRDGEMIVNGVKQPDSVYKRYVEKYSRFSTGGFSYSNDGVYNGK
jgi:hypothetical protein